MSELSHRVEEYLTIRRSLGYKLVSEGQLLASFVAYADQAAAGTLTTDLALGWARQPATNSDVYLARRLRAVRGFARWLTTLDPMTEVPPADLLPNRKYRPTPYLYSDADITTLMAAARQLSPPFRGTTSRH